jgi:hypothetical protein
MVAEVGAIMTVTDARACQVQGVRGSVEAILAVPMSLVRIRSRYPWIH